MLQSVTLLSIYSPIDIEYRRVTQQGHVFRKKTTYSLFFETILNKYKMFLLKQLDYLLSIYTKR